MSFQISRSTTNTLVAPILKRSQSTYSSPNYVMNISGKGVDVFLSLSDTSTTSASYQKFTLSPTELSVLPEDGMYDYTISIQDATGATLSTSAETLDIGKIYLNMMSATTTSSETYSGVSTVNTNYYL
jgi:hypothetical protein